MTALDCLADQARWTAWRNELGPTGKPTKIPYTPWRERAKIDDPASWVTRREAEACAKQIIDGLGGGVNRRRSHHPASSPPRERHATTDYRFLQSPGP
jgi:hypothetical protein